jgi:two-component system phosphate regulon response regulator OmpR
LHLVLTDVIMPGIHGPELARQLQAIRQVPILYMTGYAGGLEALHVSEVACIQKPFSADSLARKVREVLGAAVMSDPQQSGSS